jgi:urease accessory protein
MAGMGMTITVMTITSTTTMLTAMRADAATSVRTTTIRTTTMRTTAIPITSMGMATSMRTAMTMPPKVMSTAPAAATTTSMADVPGASPAEGATAQPDLLPLFAWLSPSFPVGAYAYSHALEWAVEAGDVRDEASLAAHVSDLMRLGFGRSDGILLAHAWRAATAGDGVALGEVNALAVCLAPSAELRLETCQQGRSFLDAVRAAWPSPALETAAGALSGEVAYPVAVGLAAGAHGLPLTPTLEGFLLALVQALVSSGIRLAPVGQTAGTRIVAGLAPAVRGLAADIPTLTLDDLGTATFRADLGSFRHETQYTRLFRS